MNILSTQSLIHNLTWRYAVKQFDPSKVISAYDWSALEDALVLSPSSFGLQPWKFIVVADPSIREQLKAASWGQSQVTDCSHHVVFAIPTQFGEADVDRFLVRTAEVRNSTVEAASGYRNVMLGFLTKAKSEGWLQEWMTRQVYIALGNFMTSAAQIGIDTCPMEGMDPAQYDNILGLPAKGLKTVVACAAGYRASSDKYATLAKVRYAKKDIIEHI